MIGLLRRVFERRAAHILLATFGSIGFCGQSSADEINDGNYFWCGGSLERKVWELWDNQAKYYSKKDLIENRLLRQQDTYALYDLQAAYGNLLSMARRCNRTDRLVEFANDWASVFDAMELPEGRRIAASRDDSLVLTNEAAERLVSSRWICRGGEKCSPRNKLKDTEVMLVNLQGLGLLSTLANFLSSTNAEDERTRDFIRTVTLVAQEHLRRLATEKQLENLQEAANIRASDIKNSASRWLFTDRLLWQLGVYAELAGIIEHSSEVNDALTLPSNFQKTYLKTLLGLFNARLSYEEVSNSATGRQQIADLDRGFWRLYVDNKFAGYDKDDSPAVCEMTAGRPARPRLRLADSDYAAIPTLGWDISHARRLVPVLDALERNRQSIKNVYGLDDTDLPPADLAKKFAARLLSTAWNQNMEHPLFTNWLDGTNGWYRVAYDNGSARCMTGYGPWGMTDVFAIGGYISWQKYLPVYGDLGRQLYELTASHNQDDTSFIDKYYKNLSQASNSQAFLGKIMFWPSLIASK